MRRSLLAAVLLALAALARAQERKTLDECIDIALRQQPTLRAAAATVAAARERVWQTASAYLPQISANYQANRKQQSGSSVLSDVIDAWLFGELSDLETFERNVRAVTADRMQRLARRYFDLDRRVEGIIRGVGRAV